MLLRSLKTDNIVTFSMAFKTYVRPVLEYATEVWSPRLKFDCVRLEKVQRKFTRVAYRKCHFPKTEYEERLRVMCLESLEIRRIKSDLCMLYKLLFGLAHFNSSAYFSFARSRRGHPLKLSKRRFGHINQKSFVNRVTNIWNSLPPGTVNASCVETFRKRLNRLPMSKFDSYFH